MSPPPNIAVIGAGQLGSRHLQALAKLDRAAHVYVIDPVPASLERAGERFAEVARDGTRVELSLADELRALPPVLDVVIVATNADHRAAVVRELLGHSRVQSVVLEKVLFQRDAEYAEIADRFAATSTNAWVNCPRRMWAGYQSLRDELRGQGPLAYRVQGAGWGLACNGIHFIDHAAFLTERHDLHITSADLQAGVAPSRRPGYVEFLGTVNGEFGDGSRIQLSCPSESVEPITLEITTSARQYTIREGLSNIGWTSITEPENAGTIPLEPLYQSQLSHLVVQDLLEQGDCPLTPYAESARLHRPLLDAFLTHYRTHVAPGAETCPIT